MSAKTGDSVSSSFYRMAADLAGIVLTRPEFEVASKIVKAEIVNRKGVLLKWRNSGVPCVAS